MVNTCTFGPKVVTLKGRSTHQKPLPVPASTFTPVPNSILEHHRASGEHCCIHVHTLMKVQSTFTLVRSSHTCTDTSCR